MKITSTHLLFNSKNLRKAIMLHLIICVASMNVFAMTSSSLEMPPLETCESCEIPGTISQTFITGAHAVIYSGRYYDSAECITYFFYCTVNDGGTGGSDISHTMFGDLNCGNTCLEDSSMATMGEWSLDNNNNIIFGDACGTIQYGTDPSTNLCGIKHDEGADGGCYEVENCNGDTYSVSHLYIAVDGNVPEGIVTMAYKYSGSTESVEIPGPGACESQGCNDDAPIAVDDVDSTFLDTPVTGMSQTNDTPSDDGGNIWTLVGTNGGAANGTVTMDPNGTYTYTPDPGYFGYDVFVYKICDIDGDCDQATVTITIHPYTNPLLSVSLINFSATKNGESSLLKWKTASEFNNSYFEIQSAIDNKSFTTIGNIQGSGNSTSIKFYEFTDKTPYVGVNYYRLKQVDFDGRATISPVRTVNFKNAQAVSVYPNPTSNELYISMNDWDTHQITTLKVIDFNGSEVLSQEATSETTRLNVTQLPVGTYFIEISNSATTQVYRFIKS